MTPTTPVTPTVLLLRGINVGGRHRLAMADLRALLTDLGATAVTTLLQSGNAVATGPADLAGRLEAALQDRHGLTVRVLARSPGELVDVVAANPFPERVDRPTQLHVVFLDQPAEPDLAGRYGDDEVVLSGREAYLWYARGSQDTHLTAVLRRLAGGTARNWRTVTRLGELAGGA